MSSQVSARALRGLSAVVGDMRVDARRESVLGRTDWFPSLGQPIFISGRDELAGAVQHMKARLTNDGLAIVDLDDALDPAALRALAHCFGQPIRELDEAVQPFVVDDVVLRLKAEYACDLPQLRPFSLSWVSLHSEGSRWPKIERPTSLLFQCLVPPPPGCGGQTLLCDAWDLVGRLQPASVEVLRRTIMMPDRCDTPVLSEGHDGPVLTFRDPVPEPAEWSSGCPAREVYAALHDLLSCAYEPELMRGVHWRRNRVAIFSNHRFLHGRSRMTDERRVLQRIRIK
ncbi:TauD/TfdA family dioxygenase [Paraburkholderia domus]|uniref:TauD/TfdA family dioxygenase n=1 Tax=Paraburkholderia domus TaxID=2793075 RepID=UPI001B17F3B3|nr:TauD/TfdA family dioxygenase [Paraburkholderia domus]CAE6851440.1 hypothetical protein R75483_07619 [Paraburkholderia domus]